MRLKKIILKNIRSYESQEIEFPAGSLLLAGDVGSGKTSILLAIEYALFGLQPGQTGSALLRNNSSIGEVSLEFELESHTIIIERKLKRGKSVTNEYSAITIDGEKYECSITELKSKIISLLGYPSEFIKKNNILYRYTVYTPQEQMKQIISEDAEHRLNILRHIFGIDKYKTIRENLVLLLNKIREDSKLIQGEIMSLDSDKNRVVSMKSSAIEIEQKAINQQKILEELSKNRKIVEADSVELESKIKEKEKLETELEKAKVLLTSKKESLSSLLKEQDEVQKSLLEDKEIFKPEELSEMVAQIDKNSNELDQLQSEYIDFLSQINSLKQRKLETLTKKERVFKIDICPTCLQDVPSAHKHNILNETEQTISSLSKETDKLEIKVSELLPKIEKIKAERKKLEDRKIKLQILKSRIPELEKAKKKLQETTKNKESTEKDIVMLTKHLESLKESILNYSKYHSLFKAKQEEIRTALTKEKNAEIYLAEFNKELQLIQKEISLLTEYINQKEQKKITLLSLSELSDWLSNHFLNLVNFTERNVMLKLRNEFSKLFSKWFSLLVQDLFEVQLDENFTPVIIHSGIEMDYSFLSGGERTAVALAYRLALNQTINSVITAIKTRDLVILDEPTEGFSEAQIDKIRDVLHELNIKQLIIVSHEQKIEGFVDNLIRIRKEGSSSYIESPNQKT
ncbi:MAG: AAA family ATPase [Nanoarchaeota archaeon]